MGAVCLAHDTRLDRFVALKIPMVSASNAAKVLRRFEIEAQSLAQVDDLHVCKIYDVGEIDGIVYMAIEYLDGGELKNRITPGQPLGCREAVRLTKEIARGLSAAHAKNVIHRDLKPANILFRQNGELVITDFGMARRKTANPASSLSQGVAIGTPYYMAPEQAGGSVPVDQRSDIYALGVMLFEMLTGTWPFKGSVLEILGQKSVLSPPSPRDLAPDVPQELAVVCLKMMAKHPDDRFASCEEVTAALEEISLKALPESGPAEMPVPTTRPGTLNDLVLAVPSASEPSVHAENPPRPTKRWSQPQIVSGIAATVVALAAILGMRVMLLTSGETSHPRQIAIQSSVSSGVSASASVTPTTTSPASARHPSSSAMSELQSPTHSLPTSAMTMKTLVAEMESEEEAIASTQSTPSSNESPLTIERPARTENPGTLDSASEEKSAAKSKTPAQDQLTGKTLEDVLQDGVVIKGIFTRNDNEVPHGVYSLTFRHRDGSKIWGEYWFLGQEGAPRPCWGTVIGNHLNIAAHDNDGAVIWQIRGFAENGVLESKFTVQSNDDIYWMTAEVPVSQTSPSPAKDGSRASLPSADGIIVNGSFSSGLNGWELEGEAATFQVEQDADGVTKLLTRGPQGDAATGRLFQKFQIPADAERLDFSLAGGKGGSTYVALKSGNKTEYRVTGKNKAATETVSWNVKSLRGKEVVFEIVDNETKSPWGYLAIRDLKVGRTDPEVLAAEAELEKYWPVGARWTGLVQIVEPKKEPADYATLDIVSRKGNLVVLRTIIANGAVWDYTCRVKGNACTILKVDRISAARGVTDPPPVDLVTGQGSIVSGRLLLSYRWDQQRPGVDILALQFDGHR